MSAQGVDFDCRDAIGSNTPRQAAPGGYAVRRDYALDGVGNRLETAANGLVDHVYALMSAADAAMNQYSTVDDTPQAYDKAGNLLNDGSWGYFYSYRNQLVRAVGATDTSYRYDALGRRVSKRTTYGGNFPGLSYGHCVYVYDGARIIEEEDPSGATRKEWVYGNGIDEPIRQRAPDYGDVDGDTNTGEVVDLYYVTNSLGTVVALVDSAGVARERYVYDVWGMVRDVIDKDGVSTGEAWTRVGNPWGFTGRQWEGEERTGLYQYRAREYAPRMGQFLERDLIRSTLHRHLSYCSGSPANSVDPAGLLDYAENAPDPTYIPDVGSGQHGVQEPSLAGWTAAGLLGAGAAAAGAVGGLPHASAHLLHYFDNSGTPLRVDMRSLLSNSESARIAYAQELVHATSFLEQLSEGVHQFNSTSTQTVDIQATESKDWFYAVGGFVAWGKASGIVRCVAGRRHYAMGFSFELRDRYNWDAGKDVGWVSDD